MKSLYLRTMDISAKWRMPYTNWGITKGTLDPILGNT